MFNPKTFFFSGTAFCYSAAATAADAGPPAVLASGCSTPGTVSTSSYSFDFTVPGGEDNSGELGYKLSYTQVPCGSTIDS